MRGISLLNKVVLAFQEGLFSTELKIHEVLESQEPITTLYLA
jgi:hypothetical protein